MNLAKINESFSERPNLINKIYINSIILIDYVTLYLFWKIKLLIDSKGNLFIYKSNFSLSYPN